MYEVLFVTIVNAGLLTVAEHVMIVPLSIIAVWAGWRAVSNVRRS